MIFIKNLKVLLSLNFFEKDLYMTFNYILDEKKSFLDYKNVNLKLCENAHFPKGVPHDFRQKLDISSQSHFV